MPSSPPDPAKMLERLEDRHERLLGGLEDLNRQIEATIQQATDAGEAAER